MKKEVKKNNKKNTHPSLTTSRTFGQKASDRITKGAGSWTFIIGFLVFFTIWITANVYGWIKGWDPFPFILLNLALSLIAAIQAPIILMSQNRTGEKDRQRLDYDYAVNRKAEREIKDIKKQLTRIENHMMKRKK